MEFLFSLQVDCESTQRTINNPGLGERAIRGLGEILGKEGLKATFVVIPPDLKAHGAIYRELEAQGHEVGLHTHPAEQGYEEFLGVYGFEDQKRIVGEGAAVCADVLGHPPLAFCPGYCSANDYTFPVLEALGFKHGTVSLPTRNLPQLACVWGNSPQDAHYAHRYNRCLAGDMDFVDVPPTVDAESRMWGGAHPQDLRIELVDAKNHWYTLYKSVKRQMAAGEALPVKYLKATTHNIFDYSDPRDFRRETLFGVIAAARQICAQEGATLVPATTADIAAAYRARVPRAAAGPAGGPQSRPKPSDRQEDPMVIDGYCVLGVDREYDLTAEALLQAMDQSQVDRAVIAPVDRWLAVENRRGNDFILQAAAAHPRRFIPACSVNPWYGQAGVEEFRRAWGEGARLLVLHPMVQGYLANDELVWPLLDAAVEARAPVYIHTGPPGNSSPWQITDLAERYPVLDFIMGHSGSTDFWNDVNDATLAVGNIYLESSLGRPFAFVPRLEVVGAHRGIMGSFAPNSDFAFEWRQIKQAVPAELFGQLCGGNLQRLLEKRGAL